MSARRRPVQRAAGGAERGRSWATPVRRPYYVIGHDRTDPLEARVACGLDHVSGACPELGFRVELALTIGLSERTIGELWRDFRRDVIEARGLTCERHVKGEHWSMVIRSQASQAMDTDRDALREWAGDRGEIASVQVAPIVDLTAAHESS